MNIEQIELRLSRKSSSPMFARLAGEYLAHNRVEEAKDLCNSGLLNFPAYSTAHLILAKCFASENNDSDALSHLQQALTFDPNSTLLKLFQTQIDPQLSHVTAVDQAHQQIDSISTVNLHESAEETSGIIAPLSTRESAIRTIEDAQELIADETVPEEQVDETGDHESQNDNYDVQPENETDRIVPESVHLNQIEDGLEVPGLIELSSHPPDKLVNDNIEETSSTASEETSGLDWNRDVTLSVESTGLPRRKESENPQSNDDAESFTSEIEIKNIPESSWQNQPLQAPPQSEDIQPDASSYEEPDQSTSAEPSGTIITTDDVEDRIFSKTLAEIYVSQGEYAEAIYTYQKLVRLRPEQQHEIEMRIKELEKKMQLKTD